MDYTGELKVGDRVDYNFKTVDGNIKSCLGLITAIINDKDCFETEHNHPKFIILNEKTNVAGEYTIREINSKIDHPGYTPIERNVMDAL